jgi:dipeptidyl aminopeptidase/acylaminoacyl peptidase
VANDEASVNGWMNQRNARYVMADYQMVMPLQKYDDIAGLARQCTEYTELAWSPDGKEIAFASSRDGNREIYVMQADGSNLRRLTWDAAWDAYPAWAPDGKRIVFVSYRDGNANLYVMNADGSHQEALTKDAAAEITPAWSPDGKRIVFVSYRDGNAILYVMNADGSHQEALTKDAAPEITPAWSPDGTKVAFTSNRDGDYDIYLVNSDGSSLRCLIDDSAADFYPAWSPDGRKIIFVSNRDGDYEIYSMQSEGTGLAKLTDNAFSDDWPSWSPDGKHIAFVSDRGGSSEIWVMDADGRNASSLASPLQFCDVYYEQRQGQLTPVLIFFPEYYRSFVVRLYNFDGKEVKPQTCTVISYEERRGKDGRLYREITGARPFINYEQARAFISEQKSGNHRIASPDPFASPVPLEPLNHYKLVYSSAETSAKPGGGTVSRVKVFEYAR